MKYEKALEEASEGKLMATKSMEVNGESLAIQKELNPENPSEYVDKIVLEQRDGDGKIVNRRYWIPSDEDRELDWKEYGIEPEPKLDEKPKKGK